MIPGWLHLALLVALGGVFLGALWLARRGFVLPTMGGARRRLETESGLRHRQLTTIADELATGRTDHKECRTLGAPSPAGAGVAQESTGRLATRGFGGA